ncbi:MAG: 30S ribosomal protein S17 [Candidatus Omnitrophica bacterium]|nr:30S ribosomal protein S17 [Candidatus Omnitrophota bacterium]
MKKRGKRKEKIGKVLSDKMDKTRVVRIERITTHPLYKKIVKKYTKVKVHDEKNKSKIGDKVKIVETRPLSKEKNWRLVEIIK